MNLDKYDKKHRKALDKHGREVQSIIDEASRKAVDIAIACGYDGEGEFYFEGTAQEKIGELLHDTAKQITANITAGVSDEWALSAAKMAAIVEYAGRYIKLPKGKTKEWTAPMNSELEQFKARKVPTTRVSNHKIVNLDLSSRVWNLSGQFKEELELAVEAGMEKGMSATELSRKVRKYLNEPDRLFRRVRDKSGALRLSKAAQAYHPGMGVYRSSYMNALRMTATEINTAYRTADHLRWKQTPFILGIEVRITDTHRHVPDICDDLKGKYPKDFKFTGWHPWCRCYAVPILPSVEELKDFDMDAAHHQGEVTDVPGNFKKWVKDNSGRIEHAKRMPNFLKDNGKYWEHIASRGSGISKKALLEAFSTQTLAEKYLSNPELLPLAVRKQIPHLDEMLRVKDNADYKDVQFDIYTGAVKATHKGHNFNKDKGWYETTVQNVGYKAGNAVILEEEPQNEYKKRSTEGVWNKLPFEIAGAETATPNNIRNALKHCASKSGCKVAVVFFPNGLEIENLRLGISKYNGLRNSGNGQWKQFDDIVFVTKKGILSQ